MNIYVKYILAKSYPDPIWNSGALGSLKRSLQQEEVQQQQGK